MHIGLLFYSDTIIAAQGDKKDIMGRVVANNDFLTALLQYSGDSKVTLFVSTEAEKIILSAHLNQVVSGKLPAVVSFLQIATYVKKNPLSVLHVLDPYIYRGIHLRNQVIRAPFAVTGVTHTLGHAPFLEWMALNLLHAPKSYDTIVCTAPTAQTLIQKFAATFQDRIVDAKIPRTEIIPLGVNVAQFAQAGPDIRAQLGFSQNDVVLLSLSRLSFRYKNDMVPLLMMIKELTQKTQRSFKFILAGATGQDKPEALIQEVIAELGLQKQVVLVTNPDDVARLALYRTADVFVSLSDNSQETFGLTLIEAMAAGLPVVASDWDGYRSLVNHGETGFLAKTLALPRCDFIADTLPIQVDAFTQLLLSQAVATDFNEVISHLKDLIENDSTRQQFASKARERAVQYGWENIIAQYLELWQKLSLEAEQGEPIEMDPASPVLHFFDHFSHYPTSVISSDDVFLISDLGKQALSGKTQVRTHGGMEEVLDLKLMAELLKETSKPLSVALLVKALRYSCDEEHAKYHMMWLYKYGYLEMLSKA